MAYRGTCHVSPNNQRDRKPLRPIDIEESPLARVLFSVIGAVDRGLNREGGPITTTFFIGHQRCISFVVVMANPRNGNTPPRYALARTGEAYLRARQAAFWCFKRGRAAWASQRSFL